MPDLFVPLDTTYNSETFSRILRKGLCSRYALEQVDANREAWDRRHNDEDDFVANMQFTPDELEAFKTFVVAEGVDIDEDEWVKSRPAIEWRLKAFFGRNVYESRTFYRVIGGLNEALQEALRVLNDGTFNAAKLAHRTF